MKAMMKTTTRNPSMRGRRFISSLINA